MTDLVQKGLEKGPWGHSEKISGGKNLVLRKRGTPVGVGVNGEIATGLARRPKDKNWEHNWERERTERLVTTVGKQDWLSRPEKTGTVSKWVKSKDVRGRREIR